MSYRVQYTRYSAGRNLYRTLDRATLESANKTAARLRVDPHVTDVSIDTPAMQAYRQEQAEAALSRSMRAAGIDTDAEYASMASS
jgi:hypothetical protein